MRIQAAQSRLEREKERELLRLAEEKKQRQAIREPGHRRIRDRKPYIPHQLGHRVAPSRGKKAKVT